MHASMYRHPILHENIKKLEEHGVEFIGPRMEEGKAKIATPKEIVDRVLSRFGAQHDLAGKHFLITAGPTLEYIDPVRIVTSKSSGRMGVEIAAAAFQRGAKVTLVYGHGTVPSPENMKVINVETTQEMYDAVANELSMQDYDVVIAAAAVADWTPKVRRKDKVPTSKTRTLSVTFKPTLKIVDAVKKMQNSVYLVLFKAEHDVSNDELIARAHTRLIKANADLIVANDIGRAGVGFGTATNELFVINEKKKVIHIPKASKTKVAHKLLDIIKKQILKKRN